MTFKSLLRTIALISALVGIEYSEGETWVQFTTNPFVIPLELPGPEDSAGGLIAADLNGDSLLDYLVTVPGHIAAYDHGGEKLWVLKTDVGVGGSSEREGLPGHHGPGVQTVDTDGDGDSEVLFLTKDNTLHAVDGASGKEEWTCKLASPPGTERWEHLVVVNFRGEGDRDLLLQSTNAEGYRMGRLLEAHSIENLRAGSRRARRGRRQSSLPLQPRRTSLGN